MSDTKSPKILVLGATGNTGSELLRQLSAAGVPARALVRDTTKATALPGVDWVRGDLEKPDSWPEAFAGIEKLYLITPPRPDGPALPDALVDAARQAGVKHVVRLSALGAEVGSSCRLLDWHARSDAHLQKSGLAWTILRPHFFVQNFIGMAAPTVRAQGAFYSPMGDARISAVDVRDIGAVAVRALTEPGHDGKVYDLTGPSAHSFGEFAGLLSEATGRAVQYVDVPPAAAREGMLQAGWPEFMADGLLELFEIFRSGRAARVEAAIETVTGRRARSLRDWVTENAAAFRA